MGIKVLVMRGVPVIQCPGCDNWHQFNPAQHPTRGGAMWSWDGSTTAPTFSPSMLERVGPYPEPYFSERKAAGLPDLEVCHSFVRAGRIEFLSDCTHTKAGQTMDLPDWSDERIARCRAGGYDT